MSGWYLAAASFLRPILKRIYRSRIVLYDISGKAQLGILEIQATTNDPFAMKAKALECLMEIKALADSEKILPEVIEAVKGKL